MSLHLRVGLEGFAAVWTRKLAGVYSTHWYILRRRRPQRVRLMRFFFAHDLHLTIEKLIQAFLSIYDCHKTTTD
jgi:hypothetical protein